MNDMTLADRVVEQMNAQRTARGQRTMSGEKVQLIVEAIRIAHAEATIEARGEEPQFVRQYREAASRPGESFTGAAMLDVLDYADTLTAQITEARREREVAEAALRHHGYRKSCDIPACNCGNQWLHGGRADRRLREVVGELDTARAELAAVKERVMTCPEYEINGVNYYSVDEVDAAVRAALEDA